MVFKLKIILVYNFLLLLFLNFYTLAQTDIVKRSFLHPTIMETGEYKHEFSFLLAKLPEDAIEEASAWIYAPLFSYKAKLGLPVGFNLNSSLSTNIITYQLRTGGQWGYNFKKITPAVGFDISYWYGKLNSFGFNSTAEGWRSYFYFNFGIAAENFTITLRGEFEYILTQKETADDLTTISTTNTGAGASFAVFIEQPLWKDKYLSLGVNFNYTKSYVPAWAVFPSWERYFFIPEVIVGFVL